MQAIICRRNGKTDIEAEIKIFLVFLLSLIYLTLLTQNTVHLGSLFLDKKPFSSSAGQFI